MTLIDRVKLYTLRARTGGVGPFVKKVTSPAVLARQARLVFGGDASNPYAETPDRDTDIDFCAQITGANREEVAAYLREIDEDEEFVAALRSRYNAMRPTRELHLGRFRIWYAFVRVLRPESIVETGVHDGLSSTVLLHALERNGSGSLVSIDLPSTDLPTKASAPGWLVPAELKHRWTLSLGDAVRLLPEAAASAAPIDIFIHDSDHSEEHRRFEFTTVRPHLAPGAVVISDQDYPSESVVSEFAAEVSGVHERLCTVAPTEDQPLGDYAGAIRLP